MKRGSEHGIEVRGSKHLSSSIELREDDIRGAQRPVDVLVRRPDGVRPDLDGAHGGVERGEAAVEGAEDGYDGVRGLLALVQRLPEQRRALRQALHLPRRHLAGRPIPLVKYE